MAGLVCFFSAKAFLISAIVIAKIVYSGFLASYANRVAVTERAQAVIIYSEVDIIKLCTWTA